MEVKRKQTVVSSEVTAQCRLRFVTEEKLLLLLKSRPKLKASCVCQLLEMLERVVCPENVSQRPVNQE